MLLKTNGSKMSEIGLFAMLMKINEKGVGGGGGQLLNYEDCTHPSIDKDRWPRNNGST
jgi:hypothetical protein